MKVKRFFFVYTDKFVYYCSFREVGLPRGSAVNPSVSCYELRIQCDPGAAFHAARDRRLRADLS